MTDFHRMSAMMKDLFPSNPEQDLQALRAAANAPAQEAAPTVDYTTQSAQVRDGSLPMDKDYSVSDFAKLAGVVGKPSGAELLQPVFEDNTKTAVAHIDKELEAGDPMIAAGALERAVKGDTLTTMERDELKPYLELFQKLITDPSMRARILAMAELLAGEDKKTDERTLTKGEEKEKERIVKGMKKAKGDFKDRYGDDAEAVMYATATKMATQNASVDRSNIPSIKERLYQQLSKYK